VELEIHALFTPAKDGDKVVSFTPLPLYPRYPLDWGLGGIQSRCGRVAEEENPIIVPAGKRTPVVQPVAHTLF